MTNNERLKKIVFWLNSQGIVKNQEDLANLLGYNPSSVSQIVSGKKPVSEKFAKKISGLSEKINLDYLLGQSENMLKTSSSLPSESKDLHAPIRYYDIDASAGPIEMFDPGNGTTYKDLVIPGFGDCEIALNVWGDSMDPELKNGEIILCKEWKEDFIEYGGMYLIVTKTNNRMIKYLKKSDNDDLVQCISVNSFYDPFELKKVNILKLYRVKGHIARKAI